MPDQDISSAAGVVPDVLVQPAAISIRQARPTRIITIDFFIKSPFRFFIYPRN
jgi:hypothetical protein